jgi:Fe-S cluster assembly protein SufD
VPQGLRLRVAAGSGALRLQLRHQPRAEVEAPLLVLELEPGAQLELIELHEREAGGACRRALVQNLQLHLQLGAGATLQHLRVVTPDAQDRVAHHVQARLGARGALPPGPAGQRQRLPPAAQRHRADGERAEAHCGALLLADACRSSSRSPCATARRTRTARSRCWRWGAARRAWSSTRTRASPRCRRRPGAPERLRGIPAAGPPRLVLRPHLEIHHDQVQAAHGATWGALPEDALFYAAQRGIDETHRARA